VQQQFIKHLNKMKKLIAVFIFFFIVGISSNYAQQRERIEYLPNFDKQTLHFGYYLGLNKNSFKVNYLAPDRQNPIPEKDMFVSVDAGIGFNLGFVIDYKLHKNINLRFEPGLVSNTKNLTFFNPNIDADVNGIPTYNGTSDVNREVSGTYLHLPLLLKFSTNRLNNIRPYVIGGLSYDYNFSSNEKNGEDNYDGEFRTNTNNFMYEVGVGMDFYLYFFKFSPSIRGVFAINDELIPDNNKGTPYTSPWTGPIDYLGTRGIFLNLTFE